MPNTKSAQKRMRSNERKELRNKSYKSSVKTAIRRLVESLESKDPEVINPALSRACAKLDKAAIKGIIHKNTASRKKSRITKRVNATLAE